MVVVLLRGLAGVPGESFALALELLAPERSEEKKKKKEKTIEKKEKEEIKCRQEKQHTGATKRIVISGGCR